MSSAMIKLQSNDNQEFDVERNVIKHSNMINTLLQDLGFDEDDDDSKRDPIPLPNVEGNILRKVLDYCTHHKDDTILTEEEREMEKEKEIGEWDKQFVNVEQSTLFDMLLASNYLDVQGMMHLCVQTVADMIKGKSVEELRSHFSIKDDFNEEEKEKIRKENAWVDD